MSGISELLAARLILLIAIVAGGVAWASAQTNTAGSQGSPADLEAVLTPKNNDTPAVKQFKETGKNPYYKDPGAIAEGFKLARAFACTHCHGEGLGGLIGPSLTNGNWRYVRDGMDKGMFETLYFGTGAGMAAWGKSGSVSEDEILKIIAFVRSKYRGDPKNITWE